jgi:hypothetical protein
MRKHGVKYMNSNQPILYSDPPSYRASEEGVGEDGAADPEPASSQEGDAMPEDPIMTVINDDFSANKPVGTLTGSGSTAIKPRTYMNFAPPPDELLGSDIRIRKARQGRKGMTQQGGDS